MPFRTNWLNSTIQFDRQMESDKKLSIRNWAEDDRPREKMMKHGIATLSNAELIAILFGTGTRNESAVELARKLLDSANNNINELAKFNIKELQKIKGIGEAKAISVITALELGKRRKIEEVIERKKIQSSNDVFDIFGTLLGDLPYEEFWILLLNRSNSIIDKIKVSQGGIAGTVTDVRIILKIALEHMASSIILCHNHPSGNKKPSEADIHITKKLTDAGKLMDIAVIDHIIIAEKLFFSFADEGMM
jgi:DNA repair protein RadC